MRTVSRTTLRSGREGADTFAATQRAIALAGGIGRFVKPGAKVGLLINAPNWWRKPGSFTTPDVTLAVLQLCLEAGAAEITYIIDPANDYWTRTTLGAQYPKLTAAGRRNPGEWTEVEIPGGVSLKKAKVNRTYLDCEVLLNLPIAKHHAGTGFSGCLKNTMGACHRTTNQFFHNGSGAKGEYEDITFLSQCIADVNLLRRPTLNVCDGTEFLLTNGPAGPGELRQAHKVIVGVNPVSVDAYGCTLLGLAAAKVAMIGLASAHGLGQPDLGRLTLREEKL
ncbi:MAG: DUF362 domain-containing protein [Opitutaceae bacterium]|nr:DUF362 domain-containing protein [Opitutaceae bacterium]